MTQYGIGLYMKNDEEFMVITGRDENSASKGFTLSLSTEIPSQSFSCFAQNTTAWLAGGVAPAWTFHVTSETPGSNFLSNFINVPTGTTPETITAVTVFGTVSNICLT